MIKARLKYIIKTQKGKVPKTFSDDSSYPPYLSMDYLREESDKILYVKPKDEYKLVDENEVLVLWDGANAGEVIFSKKGFISSTMAIVTPKTEYFEKRFLFYFLKSIEGELKKASTGTTIPHLEQNFLFNTHFEFPEVKIQKPIADYLDEQSAKITHFIQTKQRFIELLKEQRQSIIDEIFNPEQDNWEWLRLKNVVTVNDETLGEETDENFILKYIDIGNVNSNGQIESLQEMFFKNAPSRARRIVKNDNVIISTVRTYLKAITLISSEDKNLIASTGFAVLRPKGNITSEFLNNVLHTSYFINSVTSNSYGVSYPAITATSLARLKISIPKDLNKQKQIVEHIKTETRTLDIAISKAEREIELIKEYREAMIAEAVTGKMKFC